MVKRYDSKVTGGKAVFEQKLRVFLLLREKSQNLNKSSKVFNYVIFYMYKKFNKTFSCPFIG